MSLHFYGNIGTGMSVLLLVMFALYLGLYHGLFGLLLAMIAARRNGFSLRALRVFTAFRLGWGGTGAHLISLDFLGLAWGTTQIDNIRCLASHRNRRVRNFVRGIALVNTGRAAAFLVPYARRKTPANVALVSAIVLHAG